MRIDVCFMPAEYQAEHFIDYSAVVIDVLRATTSIATAFTNGCGQIIPVETVEQAFAKKEHFYSEGILTGERQGVLIQGFHLGNSPFEYSRENVGGKTVIMTTTNGTLALNKAAGAGKVYTAAFVNCLAVCDRLRQECRNVVILCAGTEGRFSVEDTLCAGLIVDRLSDVAELSDKAMACQAMYQGFSSNFAERVKNSSHAQYLTQIGFAKDVDFCLQHDHFTVVPEFSEGVIKI